MVTVSIDPEVANLYGAESAALEHAVLELLVLDLYRKSTISVGRACEILKMNRLVNVHLAADHGIPYFRITTEELAGEVDFLRSR